VEAASLVKKLFGGSRKALFSALLEDEPLSDEELDALREMIEKIRDKVKGVFLITPYYIEPNRMDMMRARMDEYCAICKKLAKEYDCIFVDFQQMFEDFCKIRHSSYLAWDRVHPNQIGATLMAREFLSHCGYKY